MKLWFQSSVAYDQHPTYERVLHDYLNANASSGTTVTVHGMDNRFGHDLSMPDIIGSPAAYISTVIPLYMDAVLTAEREGYDCFIVGTYGEPALTELRSLASIPVVSAAESSLLIGCSIAPKIGLVTLSKLIVPFLEASLERHKLGHRVSGIHLVDEVMLERDLDKLFASPQAYLDRFRAAAREAIAAGADAIIPAEAMLATIVARNDVRVIDDVPIIDGVGVPILYAEMAVTMKQKFGIEQSRRTAYTRPSTAAMSSIFGRQ